ncbi:MAG TPA: aminoglycoside phosphotransferase family protein [Candidatus Gallacutalibacter stercoravium]|nr:aminoglycoside phosphotransferase family protein [Candidatus Gallacutalibacter stercoravium]
MGVEVSQISQYMYRYYHYKACCIEPVKGGTVGETYAIDGKYFLKLYDSRLAITPRCIAALPEQLAVLDKLYRTSALADRICHPIPTVQGALFFAHHLITGVLFNLIPGAAVGYGNAYSNEELRQLAAIVKDLHAVDIGPYEKLCPKEEYDLRFCVRLQQMMQTIVEDGGGFPEPFCQAARQYYGVLVSQIQHTQKLAQLLKKKELPFVLCHTDIHGGNVMRDPKGKLYLIDWENVILAPKEADLFSFYEEDYFPLFAQSVEKEAITYYITRRDLEDIWEFYRSLQNGEYEEPEQQEVLGHVTRIFAHLRAAKYEEQEHIFAREPGPRT